MKTKKKRQDPLVEYIKANRKGSREAELENHGRPVSYNQVHVSKKVYNRKRMKADAQRHLPYLCLGYLIYLLNGLLCTPQTYSDPCSCLPHIEG